MGILKFDLEKSKVKVIPTYDTYDVTGRGPIGPYDQIRNQSWYFSFKLSCYWGHDLKLLPNHRAMGDFSSVCQAYF